MNTKQTGKNMFNQPGVRNRQKIKEKQNFGTHQINPENYIHQKQ